MVAWSRADDAARSEVMVNALERRDAASRVLVHSVSPGQTVTIDGNVVEP